MLIWWSKRENLAFGLLLLGVTLLFMRGVLWPPAGQVIAGHDMRNAYYLWHEVARQAVWQGRLPLWDSFHSAGFPFMANPQVGLFYPPAWLTLLLPANVGISWYLIFHIWLAGFGLYLFARKLGANWLGAALGGLAFAFSGYLGGRLYAGHSVPIATNSWLPWMLLGLWLAMGRGRLWAAVLGGVPLGLAILAGHFASMIYLGLAWTAFGLYGLLFPAGTNRLLLLRQMLIVLVVGTALSAVQLFALTQFSLNSTRVAAPSFEFASNYSLPPAHLITLLMPDYFGEPTRLGYWSVPTFEELTYYAGILPILGLILALRRPTRLTWFYIGLIILGLWLALGHYSILFKLFYDLFPPFRLARAPGRAAYLFTFAICALLAESLTQWQQHPDRCALTSWLRWTLSLVGLAGIAGLAASGAVFMAIHPTDTSGRLWHQTGGWAWAILLFGLGGGLLWGYLTRPGSKAAALLAVGLMALVITDDWLFSSRFVRLESTAPPQMWLDGKAIIGDSQQRILPWGVQLFEQNRAGQVGLHSVFGYDALELESLVAFTASVPDPRSTAYDILGVEYVLSAVPLDNFSDGERPLTLFQQQGAAWVYRRARVLPLARLVYDYEIIGDGQAAIERVHQPNFDPAGTAILDTPPPCQPQASDPAGTVTIDSWEANRWQLTTNSPEPALLIVSETAYPGWQVTIDGQPAEWQTAYTVVRAVCVPAGQHQVVWTYPGRVYQLGGFISLITLLGVVWAARRSF